MKKTFIILSMMAGSLLANTAFGQIVLQGLNPAPAQGFYNFATCTWGADLLVPANAATGLGVIVSDGTTGDSLGCNTLTNGAAVNGKVAFVYRGDCEFGSKAFNAQAAGAIAVIVINNTSGTMAMGAGAQGASVTIPVIMISQETGAVLRPYLDAGTLEVFLGSKLGLFANDLGVTAQDIVRPLNYATPSLLAQDSSEFQVLVGANVRNFGNQPQTNATLNAKVLLNGTTTVYDESASVASIAAGDSALIDLPAFNLPNGNVAKYTLTYTITGDATDDANDDNVMAQDFYITNGVYSKSRYDIAAGKPIRTSGYTSADGPNITWGILMNAVKGSRVKATGIQFSASTADTDSLTGQIVTGYLYEWDDANADGGISDDELTEIAIGFYTFASNLQDEFITIQLDDTPGEGPILADDKVYYAAVQYEGNVTVFFGTDEGLDYGQTITAYGQSINPLYNASSSTWYGGGFGSQYTVALALQTSQNNASIKESAADGLKLSVYPNPASDMVNVVFGNAVNNANVQVNVIDVAGRSVMNNQYNISKSQNYVTMNTASLANGTYFVKVSMNGQVVKSLPIVISK